VQFPEPRRRDDVDMIFVLADPRSARLLAAQLKFFGAGDIPTYATSQIFDNARTTRDNELNDLIFADVPALIAPDDNAVEVAAELEAYWPQRDALLRYYAMGFDAYRLVGPLFTEDQAAWPMRGLSGDLSLDAQGRVRRVLPLAQFRNGRPAAYEVAPPAIATGLIGQR
jgi:outer membrane PBP1 activator LpoA protein